MEDGRWKMEDGRWKMEVRNQTNSNDIKPFQTLKLFQIAKKNPFRNSKRIWL